VPVIFGHEKPPALRRIVVSVAQLPSALGFYRDVLGLQGEDDAGFARLTTGIDEWELLLHERPSAPSDASVAVSFAVPDLDATCRSWAERGGVVVDQPADQPWGERMAVVRDPDGHLVCLVAADD
jgi:predicted enzyme related to lactoylglutathione lyase